MGQDIAQRTNILSKTIPLFQNVKYYMHACIIQPTGKTVSIALSKRHTLLNRGDNALYSKLWKLMIDFSINPKQFRDGNGNVGKAKSRIDTSILCYANHFPLSMVSIIIDKCCIVAPKTTPDCRIEMYQYKLFLILLQIYNHSLIHAVWFIWIWI